MDALNPGWEARLAPFPPQRDPPQDAALRAAGIKLRAAEHRDLPALARLHALSRQPELLLMPWSPEQKLAFLNDQFRLQHTHYVRHFAQADFWVTTDAGGAVTGKLYLDRSAGEWKIIDILLAPEMRGKGMGSALLGWIQRAAAEAGASGVALTVTANPGAQALYERLGFEAVAGGDPPHQRMRWPAGPR